MASSTWQLVLQKYRYEPKIIPFLLAAIRILICLWPQTGYLHPDEFFQSTDISAGHFFKSQVQPVWEFYTDKPIRCMLVPHLLNTCAFKLVTLLSKLHNTQPTAYQLLVAPRLIYTLASFIVDLCLYKLCQYYSSRGLSYLPVSIVFQSSFICLGCLTRTFSNVPEVIIFALLLVVVCQLIRPRFRIVFVTPTRSTPAHERIKASTQLRSSILVGALVTLGTFNRPTFPCFAFVPLLYWLTESFRRNSHDARLNLKRVLTPVALSAALTAAALITFDTIYYTDKSSVDQILCAQLYKSLISFSFKESYEILGSSLIVTPYNFIRYNTNVENLSRYGLHSPYMHMLVNIPFAFNVLGLMFYAKLVSLMATGSSGVHRLLFSVHRIYALMLLSVLSSTILLSFIPHQEFRFLLPLIVPLVYVFAHNIYTSNRWFLLWLACNLTITGFYASIHQSGVTRASLDLDPLLKSYLAQEASSNRTLVDVSAFRCYLGPTYLWNIPASEHRFKLHLQDTIDDLSESFSVRLGESLERQRDAYPTYLEQKYYFMLPYLYVTQLDNFLQEHYPSNLTRLRLIKRYTGHFSGEELGASLDYLKETNWRGWRDAFGFALVESDLITTATTTTTATTSDYDHQVIGDDD